MKEKQLCRSVFHHNIAILLKIFFFILLIIGDLATKFYVIIKGSVNIFLPKTEEEVTSEIEN